MLTLLIGSPVCWCCITHAQPRVTAQEEAPAACPMCAKKAAKTNKTAPARKKGCQCERACSAREITQPTVAVPAATQIDLPAPAWVWEDTVFHALDAVAAEEELTVRETGPPRSAGPLYLRYCALLN